MHISRTPMKRTWNTVAIARSRSVTVMALVGAPVEIAGDGWDVGARASKIAGGRIVVAMVVVENRIAPLRDGQKNGHWQVVVVPENKLAEQTDAPFVSCPSLATEGLSRRMHAGSVTTYGQAMVSYPSRMPQTMVTASALPQANVVFPTRPAPQNTACTADTLLVRY